MKTAGLLALEVATAHGVTYADTRVVSIRNRSLTTKNGRVGHASESESLGIGVRVIADGAWGFAASADLSRVGVDNAIQSGSFYNLGGAEPRSAAES